VTRRPATTTHQTFVIDHYRPGADLEEQRRQAGRLRDAVVEMARSGREIKYLSSTVVPEDDYFQSVVEAASELLVREAHARAGISFERISVAIPIDDEGRGARSATRA
jgi:hypothetical protein